jgi:hypothetical protein
MIAKPLFRPTQIPGCALWLDAADSSTVTLSGSNVTQWRDKSGSNFNFQTSSGSPSYSNSILIPSGAILSSVSNFSLTLDTYVFIVSRLGSADGAIRMLLGFTNILSGDFSIRYFRDLLNTNGNTNDFANLQYYVNGTFNPSFPTSTYSSTHIISGQSITSGTTGITLSSAFLSRVFIGNIYEVIFYSSSPSVSQRQNVEGYLAWKWGLVASLPADHPYKTTPGNTSFPFPSVISPSIRTVAIPKAATSRPPFAPTQLSGCALWLDAADSTVFSLTGSSVTQWRDKSGNGYSLGQATSLNQPTRSGTTSGVSFTANMFLQQTAGNVPLIRDATSITILAVVRNTSNINYNNVITFWYRDGSITSATTSKFNLYTNYANGDKCTFQCSTVSGNPSVQSGASLVTNVSAIIGSSASSTSITANLNGTLASAAGLTLRTASADALLTLGYPGGFVACSMFEILIYTTELTVSQRQNVEGYLAWKWGLVASLPNGHPFKQTPLAPFPYAVRRAVPGPLFSSFSLRSISGITLWMDAADASTLSLSGTSVTQWRDKSISGYVFTSPSPPVSGVNTMNGLNVVTNQGSQYLQITNYSQTFTTCSFFVVMKPTGSFGSWDFLGIFMSQTTGAPYFYIELSATMVPNRYSFATTVNGRDAFAGNLGSSSVSGITYLLSGFVTGNTSTNFQNLNGTPFESYNYNLTTGGLASNLSNVTIRLAGWPSNSKSGQYAEILMFDRILPQRDYQQVEGYLAWKWGLQTSLPANHPYRANSPK